MFLRTNQRAIFTDSAIQSPSISGVNCQVGLRVSSSARPFYSSILLPLPLPISNEQAEVFPQPSLALVESSNLPSPHMMIEFRSIRAVTYNLLCQPFQFQFLTDLGRRITGSTSVLSLIIAERSFCFEIFLLGTNYNLWQLYVGSVYWTIRDLVQLIMIYNS